MDLIQRIIFTSDDYYERETLDKVFRLYKNGIIGKMVSAGEGVILDIGANIGNHSLFFCNEYKAKKVYCFEPMEKTFSILKKNIEINQLQEKVILNKFGLGNRDGRASATNNNLLNIGGTAICMDDGGQLEVHSLDGLNIDEPVILVKIDVEGMERE
ncbi:MAG TPA: hypothetical protein DCZ40_00125, partial [Lachnospiraceae bacterium]|nr:hypothetical protein [Lachnospiraceae bacterium]